jgi:hypothetical protein
MTTVPRVYAAHNNSQLQPQAQPSLPDASDSKQDSKTPPLVTPVTADKTENAAEAVHVWAAATESPSSDNPIGATNSNPAGNLRRRALVASLGPIDSSGVAGAAAGLGELAVVVDTTCFQVFFNTGSPAVPPTPLATPTGPRAMRSAAATESLHRMRRVSIAGELFDILVCQFSVMVVPLHWQMRQSWP